MSYRQELFKIRDRAHKLIELRKILLSQDIFSEKLNQRYVTELLKIRTRTIEIRNIAGEKSV